jgi:hypothetical protein
MDVVDPRSSSLQCNRSPRLYENVIAQPNENA